LTSEIAMLVDEYASYADEGEEVRRVRGFEFFIPAPLPAGIKHDKSNRCSVTALAAAWQFGFTPVRGYALLEREQGLSPVWLGHWWAVRDERRVVDASWTEPALAYLGERIEVRGDTEGDLSGYTIGGDFISDLGVYVYAPTPVAEVLNAMLTEYAG